MDIEKEAVSADGRYEDRPWFKIDNAATLYAAARTKNWTRTFRTAIVLDEEIDPKILQKALDETAKRFPFFCVQLRDGFFWSYFERIDELPKIVPDTNYPYRPIDLGDNKKPCFRVLYGKNRIVLEGFHSISDGSGTKIFLSTLTAHYLKLKGEKITCDGELVLSAEDEPKEREARDDYYTYADPNASAKNPPRVTVHIGENEPLPSYVSLIHGICRVEDLRAAAKKHSLTITEYLTAILIYTYFNTEEHDGKPISVSIPIDLRKRFPSKSLRNFCFMTDVTFDPKEKDEVAFDEVCDSIRGGLAKKSAKEELLSAISSNVSAASNPVLKIVPYFIKRIFLKGTYEKVQHTYTAFFSNLGSFDFPSDVAKHVVRVEACLGSTPYQHFGCAAASVNGIFTFTFSSGNQKTEKQKFFFRFLSSDGVPLRIESNVDYRG
ncbi:MAG: hypothetical protein Q4D20_05175 [Clostridia bacterium]|nr:hypothetical protein [Clostridia bacterium]